MDWDDKADGWDEHPAVRAYSEAAFTSLGEVLARHDRSLHRLRVLDFGCGTGLLTEHMAEQATEVVGLDPSGAMIAVLEAKRLPNVRCIASDLAAAVRDDALGSFDLITCSSVCAFVPDYPGTVRTLARLLRPGGLFVQWDWELDPSDEEPYGLTREAIREALVGADLTDVAVDVGFRQPFEGQTMAPLRGVGRRPV